MAEQPGHVEDAEREDGRVRQPGLELPSRQDMAQQHRQDDKGDGRGFGQKAGHGEARRDQQSQREPEAHGGAIGAREVQAIVLILGEQDTDRDEDRECRCRQVADQDIEKGKENEGRVDPPRIH
ncbi:MAG: hypothetical protein FD129_3157 [bacterium]|nr:MAG: hypothetical protein FD129_3157 [bacterium]